MIKRLKCKHCGKRFSTETNKLAYQHKKRRVVRPLYQLLSSGVSMRRSAKLLGISRGTVKRKLIYLSLKSQVKQRKFLELLKTNRVKHVQFDDLITIEHTKLKPLSVTIAVDAKTRKILGANVSQIPAFGHLAHLSRKKYGKRPSEHARGLVALFKTIHSSIDAKAVIRSDEHKLYGKVVKKYLPKATHEQFKSARAAVVGQGEMKKCGRDPLFMINHTCAMFRANINRLIRKTWCTTKLPEMLNHHINVYIDYHNSFIVA